VIFDKIKEFLNLVKSIIDIIAALVKLKKGSGAQKARLS
jgi:hypothetical protein